MPAYKQTLREITSASNMLLFRVVEDVSYVFSDGRPNPWSAREVEEHRERFLQDLRRERDAFVFGNTAILLGALEHQAPAEPVCV
jgi:hypothetical protein